MSQPERFIGLSYRRNEEVISAAEPVAVLLSEASETEPASDVTELSEADD